MSKKPPFTNRLVHEKSPYLLQHAHNPVDWYPWGDEAFEKAKEQDKPIFLSIGYATCHWCHVMEHESFENLEVASLLNETFINIKVDREELPEVDNLYMEFAQSMMAGSAGWPLNLILTHSLEPFFAATYLPPKSKHGMMGMLDLIERIQEVWQSGEREKVIMQAGKIVEVFAENVHLRGDELPGENAPQELGELLYKLADPVYGGLKGSPKFPIGYQYLFLLRYFFIKRDMRSIFLVERTLDMMQRGGIYDHLGGGFSRYSVDEEWLQPHFEKMLYDNALLLQAYLETYQATGKEFYKDIVEHIASYVLRDMQSTDGGFYSAEDADSEGHEGYFYTWEKKEVINTLGEDGELFCDYYGITEEGNFEGRNILHTKLRIPEFAQEKKLDPKLVKNKIDECSKNLFERREKRPHPFKDDKILCSWNGLMIYSLAEAGRVLNKQAYLDAAEKAAVFIKDHLWRDGVLFRRWRDRQANYPASLDDYAFMIRGALALFEADRGYEWFEWAVQLNKNLSDKFKLEGGAYYQTDGDERYILIRKCQYSDGAEPSGNSIQCENLLRLNQITFYNKFLADAEDVLKAAKKYIDNYPPGYGYHMMNLNRYYDKTAATVVVALNDKESGYEDIKRFLRETYSPHRVAVFKREGMPICEDYKPINGETTVYICRQGACQEPLTEISEIEEAIHKV